MTNNILSFTTKDTLTESQQLIKNFAKANNLSITNYSHKIRKKIDQKNPILDVIYNLSANDAIIVYDALDIGLTTLEATEVLSLLTEQSIRLFVVKYNESFLPKKEQDTKSLLQLLQHIESEFAVMKQIDSVGRRRHSNSPLGRPKGRKNKELKLDKHQQDIQKYLDLKISKASIAKLIGCHAQTLYNYIDKKDFVTA
jgi:DNA invertase Pin-like site-specific DNA recombinase